ncbi:MAG: hypothetical protein HZY76_03465 [Anaerolineae bacterium]|nr:MAG: hypothetical protein HZY76_03465 [Anaerolineae bacterium]
MQAQVARAGALPQGVALALPAQYVDMTGHGELLLSADGLPVRQQIELGCRPPPTRITAGRTSR